MCKSRKTATCPNLIVIALALAGITVPIGTLEARTPPSQAPDATSSAGQVLGTHATRGIVQTIDADTMVITRAGNRGTMAFSLTSSTHREGLIVVGASVSVRYRDDRKNHVATAIALQGSKDPKVSPDHVINGT